MHTLRALPLGICSYDYRLDQGEGTDEVGRVRFRNWSRRADITVREERLEGVPTGFLASSCEVRGPEGVWARTRRVALFSRSVLLQLSGVEDPFVVRQRGWGGSEHQILLLGKEVGRIERQHAFTRRATVRYEEALPETVAILAFWVAASAWRRNAGAAH